MENQNVKPYGISIAEYLSHALAMAAKTDEALIDARYSMQSIRMSFLKKNVRNSLRPSSQITPSS